MKHLNLTPHLYDYLLDISLHEHPVLLALREETAKLSLAAMQVAPEILKSSMRFSFGFDLTEAKVVEGARRVVDCVESLKNHLTKT